jgi:hypothetical protein
MWIKIKQRLINLDRATDIGVKEKAVTIYYGDNDFWCTYFDSEKEAQNIFDFLSNHIGAKDVMSLSELYSHLKTS